MTTKPRVGPSVGQAVLAHAKPEGQATSPATGQATIAATVQADDLPVVARVVIEVRSDGRTTIARGGMEDLALGQRVTVDARGDSPLALAMALAKSLVPALGKLPRFAAQSSVRGLLGKGKGVKK